MTRSNPCPWIAFACMIMATGATAEIVDGIDVGGGAPTAAPVPNTAAPPLAAPPGSTLIDFDGSPAPCLFVETTALRDAFAALGVVFDGPGGNDGGAILDQCGGFGVSGFSPPNFLAFNGGALLMDGGIPRGPETLLFDPLVSHVEISAGSRSGSGQLLTVEAFGPGGAPIDMDSVILAPQLQLLSVAGEGIREVRISGPSVFVLDDLAFLPVEPMEGDTIVSFSVEAGLLNGTLGGEVVRPVDAVDLGTGDLVFSAFPDTILEDIDAFHVLSEDEVVFSTSTDVTQGFGGIPYIRNGDLVLWDGATATLLFSELVGFGGPHNNIDAFSMLPNGNWLLSTDLDATLGGLFFQNGDIVEYDPDAGVATLYEGLDEATIFTGTPNSNADIDALHATADGTVIFSIRSDGIGRVGNGPTHGFADVPRTDLFEIDPATLDANLFLDGDGLFDGIARNLDAVSAASTGPPAGAAACGLGYELALVLSALVWLRSMSRRRRPRGG